ncbi:MAG: hypothetical protein A2167_08720 [Planctomycetes bacterium RBG_13_46_10]|nr:MAG: hypothetical protein A2167_08720 [Planctomycetes bacterium RBG_13_46_10]
MPKSKGKRSRYISYLLRFAVAGAALYLAFKGESIKQVSEVLLGLQLWIFIAALGIYIISQLIFVFRWFLLLRAQAINIGFCTALKLHFLGLFYNNCLPGSVGGDFIRAWYVTKHTNKKLQAALSVFVDRLVGLIGIIIMAACSYWFIPAGSGNQQFESRYVEFNFLQRVGEYKWIFAGIGIAISIITTVFIATIEGRAVLHRYLKFTYQKGLVAMVKIHDAIRIYYDKKLILAAALLLTFFCQGLFIFGMVLIGYGIGINAPIKYYFIFFPVSWLLGTLPISVGGAGIMEWWLKVMFMRVCAVSSEHALALALCQRLIWLFGSLPGAAIHMIGAHLPRDFFVDGK